jgi:hypothetical protein
MADAYSINHTSDVTFFKCSASNNSLRGGRRHFLIE